MGRLDNGCPAKSTSDRDVKPNLINVQPISRWTRVEDLDIYKGVAILLVVLGHLVKRDNPDFDHNLIFKCIQMFHMPMFFVICGMVYSLRPGALSLDELGKSILKRTRQLFVPFVAWFFVSFALMKDAPPLLDALAVLVKGPDNGLWFLWVLFVISCVADLVKYVAAVARIPRVPLFIASWAIVFHLSIHVHALGLWLIAFHLPFFVAGVYHRELIARARGMVVPMVVVSSIAYPFLVHIWDRVNLPQVGLLLQQSFDLPMSTSLYTGYLMIGYGYQALFAVVGTVVFFAGVKAFTPGGGAAPWISRAMSFIGQRTLEIYAIHMFLMETVYLNAAPLLETIVAMVICVAVPILIADYLLKPNRVAAFFLLGKSPGGSEAKTIGTAAPDQLTVSAPKH